MSDRYPRGRMPYTHGRMPYPGGRKPIGRKPIGRKPIEYREAGEWMSLGVLAGNHDAGWTVWFGDYSCSYPTRATALEALVSFYGDPTQLSRNLTSARANVQSASSARANVQSASSARANVQAWSARANVQSASSRENVQSASSTRANVQVSSARANVQAWSARANVPVSSARANVPVPDHAQEPQEPVQYDDYDGDSDDDYDGGGDDGCDCCGGRNTNDHDHDHDNDHYNDHYNDDDDDCSDSSDFRPFFPGHLVIGTTTVNYTHCGYCSDPGEVTRHEYPCNFRIPLNNLPESFINRYFVNGTLPDMEDYGEFWMELRSIAFQNRTFSRMWNILREYIDYYGNQIRKEHGSCCGNPHYSELNTPYTIRLTGI